MEDLANKITEYNGQRDEVDKFLLTDPHNPQFLKIRHDLDSLIHMSLDLLKSSMASTERDVENELSEDEDDSDDEVPSSVVLEMVSSVHGGNSVSVGSVVEVLGGDRAYAAVITEILPEGQFKVKYFEFETEVMLPGASLVPPPVGPLHPSEVSEGFKGQCKFAQDQLYYDAIVTAVTLHGFMVHYPQYGNAEEVPIHYLRPLIQKQKKEVDKNAIIKIPENLKILPTDTEEVILLILINLIRWYFMVIFLYFFRKK